MKKFLFFITVLLFNYTANANHFPTPEKNGVKYVWQVDAKALILGLINEEDKNNTAFRQALKDALSKQASTDKSLVSLLKQTYKKHSNQALAPLFSSNKTVGIHASSSNKEVFKLLQTQVDHLIKEHIVVVQKRVKSFGNTMAEIAPIKNTDRFFVKIENASAQTKVQIETIGKLGFWELHSNASILEDLVQINDALKEAQEVLDTTSKPDSLTLEADNGPLFNILSPMVYYNDEYSTLIGFAKVSDVHTLTNLLTGSIAKNILKKKAESIRFLWSQEVTKGVYGENYVTLYALNTKGQKTSSLNQTHILSSTVIPNTYGEGFAISINMTPEGSTIWKKMTTDNVGKQIALVLDNKVYSAPLTNEPIKGGLVHISGGFDDIQKAKNFNDILSLKATLPGQLTLIEEEAYSNKN